ncbi:MAG: EAL domain-containing protein [Rhizobiaceae bacterium]|nr:EAL domain-containing protein [Rhizobiaceae bacterium]
MKSQMGKAHEGASAAPAKRRYHWFAALLDVGYRQQAGRSQRLSAAAVVVLLLIVSAATVYVTGGTRFAYPHMAYIPIVVAAFLFGLPGGIVAGAMAGLALGPFMPLDVAAGTAQPTASWLTRLGFFTLIGGVSGMACSALARQLQTIRENGYLESVTRLPNRNACIEFIEALMESRQPPDLPATVVSIRLGGFAKNVSIFGNAFADTLQVHAAGRLLETVPVEAKLFCLGNGVFALVFRGSLDNAKRYAAELTAALTGRFEVDGLPILSSGHAGLAQDVDGPNPEALLRASTSASQEAETAGSVLSIYDRCRDHVQRAQLSLLPDLKRAISTGEGLALHYQPIVDLRSGRCRGAEALIRWQHASRGAISPAEFVPAAEQTNLIRELSDLVLRLAMQDLARWQAAGVDIRVSVNFSIRDLEDETLTDRVRHLLDIHRVEPSSLEIEVTESGLMTAQGLVVRNLAVLRNLGVSVALDDFGTGQSSLAQLRVLPADVVKLDRAFLCDLKSSVDTQAVVTAAIQMAHHRNQKVVAEGIEDRATLQQLRRLSCDFGQGFFIGRPQSRSHFEAWLQRHQGLAAAESPADLAQAGIDAGPNR